MTEEREDVVEEAPSAQGEGSGGAPSSHGQEEPVVREDVVPEAAEEASAGGDTEAEETAEVDPLGEVERQRDEYLELAQRTKAEFENYRKRMVGELAAAAERGKGEVAGDLVNVLDNLERALEAADVSPQTALEGGEIEGALQQGVALTYRELCGVLNRAGVEAIDPSGEKFDPSWHEAIQTAPGGEGTESGTVLQVLQKGYRLGDRVLRPARVIVSA